MVAKVPEFPDFAFWDLENSTKIQLLMVFLALVGRWPPSSSLKFDARQRWRPNPTLHLMHSTNPPGPVPLRAASQPQNFNRLDPTRPRLEELPRALHSLRPFLLVCRQMIYMAQRAPLRPPWVWRGAIRGECVTWPGKHPLVSLEEKITVTAAVVYLLRAESRGGKDGGCEEKCNVPEKAIKWSG